MRPAVDAEKAGIPSVVVAVTGFMELARITAKALGVEGLRVAEYPGAVGVHLDEIRRNVKEVVFDQIVDGLTKQGATTDSTAGGPGENPREIVFSGTLEQVNEF
ncbi:unnamed protein product, partial [marine sediment metagenome]